MSAIIFNFNIANPQETDPDQLVKLARNIGIRTVSVTSTDTLFISTFKKACLVYTLSYAENLSGNSIDPDTEIDLILKNKVNRKQTVFTIDVLESGNISAKTNSALTKLNQWLHWYGHAFDEGILSNLTTNVSDAIVLNNQVAPYQVYVFLKQPYPKQLVISKIDQKPSIIDWIDNREELRSELNDHQLTIDLTDTKSDFGWRALRIMLHRPEDDMPPTQF